MFELIIDSGIDAILDCLKMLPFLYAAFVLLEWLEQHSNSFLSKTLQRNMLGPVAGAVFGCIPQCGFSALASSLYAGGAIPLGTLLAVYLSTSDEAILIMLSNPSAFASIGKLLICKVIIGLIVGYLLNTLVIALHLHQKREIPCDDCGCHHHHNVFRSAWKHTYKLFLFILVCTFVLNVFLDGVGMDSLKFLFLEGHWYQSILTALIGLIPNCAASIFITQLYLEGIISFASAISGLCSSAGIGLILLFKLNRNRKRDLMIAGLLYAIAVGSGIIIHVLGI